MNYTRGPWIWQPMQGDDMPKLFNQYGAHVCDFGNDRTYYPTAGTPPDIEDARLIAAAPDLLEALRSLMDDIGNDGIACPLSKNMAREAIDKATGGE
jgi:hypothetical protein